MARKLEDPTVGGGLPEAPVDSITAPLHNFLRVEALSGIVLVVCTLVALLMANTGAREFWDHVWHHTFTIGFDAAYLEKSLAHWVNDGLMVLFFFVVGLEIKREVVDGHLSDKRQLLLPLAAAIGGVAVPAALFVALVGDGEAARGWAVPMATDIAFVVGCLALFGKRVPTSLKIFVLSLAIVDDLIAVLVIALFYAEGLEPVWLIGSGAGIALTVLLQKLGVRRVPIYVVVGLAVWLCTFEAGIHPTVAGVILGILTPVRPWVSRPSIREVIRTTSEAIDLAEQAGGRAHRELERLAFAAREARSPLDRLEDRLHPWVSFFVMPVFALANAAVPVSAEAVAEPLAVGIAVALFVGKPLGILGAVFLVAKLGLAKLPGLRWSGLSSGAGILCGTGFT
ncbi:MAG: Na+/H+ antiporter NhaA [Planctomycetota bacterium]